MLRLNSSSSKQDFCYYHYQDTCYIRYNLPSTSKASEVLCSAGIKIAGVGVGGSGIIIAAFHGSPPKRAKSSIFGCIGLHGELAFAEPRPRTGLFVIANALNFDTYPAYIPGSDGSSISDTASSRPHQAEATRTVRSKRIRALYGSAYRRPPLAVCLRLRGDAGLRLLQPYLLSAPRHRRAAGQEHTL